MRTCWRRQRPSDSVYIGDAASSVSFLVEHVELVFLFRTWKVGEEELCSGVSSTLGHARSKASKLLNRLLKRDRTRFTKLFGIVKLCLFSNCFSHRPNH